MARREAPQAMACGVVERVRHGKREILIGRVPGPPYEDKWTFPGGPVERGESPEAALRRALDSLLGLQVEVRSGQPPFDLAWDDVVIRWRFFFCQVAGEVQNTHYREVRWVAPGDLQEYEFEPAAQQVVDWLLEPQGR